MTFDRTELEPVAARAQGLADLFRLPLHDRTWRGSVGEFAGSGTGSSLDFQDHRAYHPGDDPRHINWQAYARTGETTMKLFREEVRPLVEILFDVTDSMFLGEEKRTRSLELFYFATFAALRAGASVTATVIKGDEHRRLALDDILSHRWAETTSNLPPTDSAAAPDTTRLPLRANSLRLLLSDLLHPRDPEATLRPLLREKGRALAWCPYALSESAPEWRGNYEFVDAETGREHPHRVAPDLLQRYREAYRRHFERWKASGQRHRTPIARIPAEAPFEKAIREEALPFGAMTIQ